MSALLENLSIQKTENTAEDDDDTPWMRAEPSSQIDQSL